MATLSTSRSSRSPRIPGVPAWVRSISWRRIGLMLLILAILYVTASYTAHAMLNYVEGLVRLLRQVDVWLELL